MSRDEEIAKLLAKHAERLRHLESLEPFALVDRSRLECTEQVGIFDISAGAGVWENTNCSDTIDLPCESDLQVKCFINWWTDTIRAASVEFRFDLDGASQAGETVYIGATGAGSWFGTTVTGCFFNVPSGIHTITVQVRRLNAGDAIRLRKQNLAIHSVSWP